MRAVRRYPKVSPYRRDQTRAAASPPLGLVARAPGQCERCVGKVGELFAII